MASSAAFGQPNSFINWESPQVHPLDITPDGTRLLAVNTADNRLEVFSIIAGGLQRAGSIQVGLDPVSVRARTNDEAWVANHVSDSVSIVNLTSMNTVRTLATDDEPADVIFAGDPQRAFVSVSQRNQIKVYDPASPDAAPIVISIDGEDPRALATDGLRVFAAIFESGNRTTILRRAAVSEPDGPYGGQNPPPNLGMQFSPPIAPGLPLPPPVSLIVRREGNAWMDDNGHDWSAKVTWNLQDDDVAIIDAQTLAVSYSKGLMNINMALAVHPTGRVTVVGTDALNHIRYEPNISGRFLRVNMASFDPLNPTDSPSITDLNPHLDYSTSSVPHATRDLSIGDPRGIAWNSKGTRGYISGMGSNNLIVVGPTGNVLNRMDVGQGPTGLVLDESRDRLYVLNRFDATISIINTVTEARVGTASIYDPTPHAIRLGRPFLYDTHRTSGLGYVSCASCHVDARMDQLAWDLGDPQGQMSAVSPKDCFNLLPPNGFNGPCAPFHPMKGPMITQTLVGIIPNGSMHWRGDRANLAAFDVAFTGLQGDDAPPTAQEMAQFEAFIATLRAPANPNRTFFDALPVTVPGSTGIPSIGLERFQHAGMVGGSRKCTDCHVIDTGGTNGRIMPASFLGEVQTFKVPHLRNQYEKTGFNAASQQSNRGFGFLHDGSDDTLLRFLSKPIFSVAVMPPHMEAFLLCFPTETHPAAGVQVTLTGVNNGEPAVSTLLNNMQTVADSGVQVSIVAKGVVASEYRGFAYMGAGTFQSDRQAQSTTMSALVAAAGAGNEITFTMVPDESKVRIGIDRDEDGYFDRDELDAGSDPADPTSIPLEPGDVNGDGLVNIDDLLSIINSWGVCPSPCSADVYPWPAGDAVVNIDDLLFVINNWG
jgi:DNA-binding beta-propeller fold protein YncE